MHLRQAKLGPVGPDIRDLDHQPALRIHQLGYPSQCFARLLKMFQNMEQCHQPRRERQLRLFVELLWPNVFAQAQHLYRMIALRAAWLQAHIVFIAVGATDIQEKPQAGTDIQHRFALTNNGADLAKAVASDQPIVPHCFAGWWLSHKTGVQLAVEARLGVALHATREINQAAMAAGRQIDSQKITVISPDKLGIVLPAARAGKFD
ncbi:hypothetical protein PE143B_0101380 [Pseudomonas extremaustralis 14-3 substr. 14-3b]|nr:hypothetical protein PE143B_0101380 [Pseudomonas extremaustralis 14-3 substr. 14-3b]